MRLVAIVLTLKLDNQQCLWNRFVRHARNFLPCSFDILHLGLNTQLSLGSDLPSHTSDFCGKDGELINHVVDSIDEIQDFSRHLDAHDFLREITTRDSGLLVSTET